MRKEKLAAILSFDGGARSNPGPAACAVVVETPDGKRVDTFSKYLGETTNNVAEYEGLLAALDYAFRHGLARIKVLSDSELLVRQVSGAYKIKSPGLKPLHQRAMAKIARLESFAISHIPREQNREADRLVNKALDDVEECSYAGHAPASTPTVMLTSATYRKGVFNVPEALPLAEGEEVELEIHRKNKS